MKPIKFKKGFLALLIILAVAILGLAAAVAFSLGKFRQQPLVQTPAVVQDKQVESLETLSGSDKVEDIDKEVNSTDIDSLDAGLDQVNSDLNSL